MAILALTVLYIIQFGNDVMSSSVQFKSSFYIHLQYIYTVYTVYIQYIYGTPFMFCFLLRKSQDNIYDQRDSVGP